mmetsp:Transcript_10884/g.21131  ORF Transcript_10884/g.21131 Transcript_10884/m.21131 type:complete len:210 (+) Transcript_10884:48-677(+)
MGSPISSMCQYMECPGKRPSRDADFSPLAEVDLSLIQVDLSRIKVSSLPDVLSPLRSPSFVLSGEAPIWQEVSVLTPSELPSEVTHASVPSVSSVTSVVSLGSDALVPSQDPRVPKSSTGCKSLGLAFRKPTAGRVTIKTQERCRDRNSWLVMRSRNMRRCKNSTLSRSRYMTRVVRRQPLISEAASGETEQCEHVDRFMPGSEGIGLS